MFLGHGVGIPLGGGKGGPDFIALSNPDIWLAPDRSSTITLTAGRVSDVENIGAWVNSFDNSNAATRLEYDTTTFTKSALKSGLGGLGVTGAEWTGAVALFDAFRGAQDWDVYGRIQIRQLPGGGFGAAWFGERNLLPNNGFSFVHRFVATAGQEQEWEIDYQPAGYWLGPFNTMDNDLRTHTWRHTFTSGGAGNRYARLMMDGIIIDEVTGGPNPVPTSTGNQLPATICCYNNGSGANAFVSELDGWLCQLLAYSNRNVTSAEDANIRNALAKFGAPYVTLFNDTFPTSGSEPVAGYTSVNVGTAGTYAIASNALTITNAAGVARDLKVLKDSPTFTDRNNMVTVDVTARSGVAPGYDIVGVGLCKDAANLIIAEYNRTGAGDIHINVRIGGVDNPFFYSFAEGAHAAPYQLACGFNADGNFVRFFSNFDGVGLRFRGSTNVTPVVVLSTLTLADWHPCVALASDGGATITTSFQNLKATYWT